MKKCPFIGFPHRRRLAVICLLFFLCVTVSFVLPPSLTGVEAETQTMQNQGEGQESGSEQIEGADQDEQNPEGQNPEGQNPEGSPPTIQAESALVYCRNTGEIIYGKKADKRLSPYSITKILTAFLASERLDPDASVTISAEAASVGGSSMSLQEGEVVTVRDLLYGTFLLSGNDAATALAETTSGTTDDFVDLMNTTAANIGCKDTHFVNPTGLINDVEAQYTTAEDMLKIAKIAFSKPEILEIAGSREYRMGPTNKADARDMQTHVPYITSGLPEYRAGKTGYWDEKSTTIVLDYYDKGLELIAVMLGAEEDKRDKEVKSLIDYAAETLQGVTVVEAGKVVGQAPVRHGKETRVDAVTASDCFCYIPKHGSDDLVESKYEFFTDLEAPIKAGDKVGEYRVYLADEEVTKTDLIAAKDIETGWLPSYIGISNKTTAITLAVLAACLLLLFVRLINKARASHRRRKIHKARVRALAEKELREEKRGR